MSNNIINLRHTSRVSFNSSNDNDLSLQLPSHNCLHLSKPGNNPSVIGGVCQIFSFLNLYKILAIVVSVINPCSLYNKVSNVASLSVEYVTSVS